MNNLKLVEKLFIGMLRNKNNLITERKLDEILNNFRKELGYQYISYKNHCCRVLRYCQLLDSELFDKFYNEFIFAAAFHDIGIWTNKTLDYLEPSTLLAVKYNKDLDSDLIKSLIKNHHKITSYDGDFKDCTNLFIKADLIDLSKGIFRYSLSKRDFRKVKKEYIYYGFHYFLLGRWIRWIIKNPFTPLPMFRL